MPRGWGRGCDGARVDPDPARPPVPRLRVRPRWDAVSRRRASSQGAAATLEAIRAAGARAIFLTNNPTSLPADYAAQADPSRASPRSRKDVVSSTRCARPVPAPPRRGRQAPGHHRAAARRCPAERRIRASRSDPTLTDVVVVAWDRTFDYAKLHGGIPGGPGGRPDRGHEPRPVLPDPRRRPARLCRDAGRHRGVAPGAAPRQSSASRRSTWRRPSSRGSAFSPDDTVLVGDRLLTDVRMARRAGMHAALVLTGATSQARSRRQRRAPRTSS